MSEKYELVLTEKQIFGDKLAVKVLGGIAAVAASQAVEKIYKAGITAYRLRKVGGFVQK